MALDRPSSLIQPNPARIQISLFLVAHSIKGWCDTGYANFNVSSFFFLICKECGIFSQFLLLPFLSHFFHDIDMVDKKIRTKKLERQQKLHRKV